MRSGVVRFLTAPLVWWARVPEMDPDEQTAWQRGKSASAAAVNKHPVFLYLAAVVPGVATAAFAYHNLLCRVLSALAAGTAGYCLIPLGWACAVALVAPVRQRDEARTALAKAHEDEPTLIANAKAEAERPLREALEQLQERLAAAEERLAKQDRLRAFYFELNVPIQSMVSLGRKWNKMIHRDEEDGTNTNLEVMAHDVRLSFVQVAEMLREQGAEFGLDGPATDFERPIDLQYNPPTPRELLERVQRAIPQLQSIQETARNHWWDG